MVPNSVRDAPGSAHTTPHSTPQRPRRASSADGRRDPGTPQLPQHGHGAGSGGVKRQHSTPQHGAPRPQSGDGAGFARQHSAPANGRSAQYNSNPRAQSGETNSARHNHSSPRPQSGDYTQLTGAAAGHQARGRVSGSPTPQQAPPPQPVYAVPQIKPQTVLQESQVHQYASLQHHMIQQAPPPQSQYMQLPLVNAASTNNTGGAGVKDTGNKFKIGNPDSDEDDPNWPPPPPPEYMVVDGAETGSSSSDRSSSAEGSQHRGSIQDSHASIIQCLNEKFAARQPTHNTTLPLDTSSSPARPNSQSSDDITPTAENQSDGNMLNQIQRGVKLRKTISNDRSAPKFT